MTLLPSSFFDSIASLQRLAENLWRLNTELSFLPKSPCVFHIHNIEPIPQLPSLLSSFKSRGHTIRFPDAQ